MSVSLTMATNDSDQVRDLASGAVTVPGVELTYLHHEVEEIFFRFTRHREWDISELSLGKFSALRARGDESVVGIPAFLSRSFRHSAIYIRADGPRDDPGALAGGRIGVPEWTVTATIWARGLLAHEYGVDPTGVRWVQGGTNEPGRVETLPVALPDSIDIRAETERSLSELLVAGEIDAIVAPHTPAAFDDPGAGVVRLFSNPAAVEREYYARTAIFPIMHLVVMRADVHARHPWVAMNLLTALTQAKDRSLARIADANAPRTPLPWGPAAAAEAAELMGPDLWPYGVQANRATLEAFLQQAHEQGVCGRRLEVEELFAPETLQAFRV